MTDYRLWPSTNSDGSTNGGFTHDLGVQFKVNEDGVTFNGFYFWANSGTFDTDHTKYSFRLYSTANGTSGSLISGSTTNLATDLTQGAWNYQAVDTPIALTNGTTYVAVLHYSGTSNSYSSTTNYWSSGSGASGITAGPITAPGTSTALGGNQCAYNEPSSTPAFPTNSLGSNYWIDVSVSTSGGGGSSGITQVGSTTSGSTAGANSVSCSKPSGVVSGNLLLALVTSNDGAITSSGWTVLGHGSGQPNLFDSTWLYKIAGSSEPSSYSFSTGDASSPPMIVNITAWDGVDTTNGPFGGTNKVSGNFPGSGSSTEPKTITGATSTVNALPIYSRACRVSRSGTQEITTFSASGVTELGQQGKWSGGSVTYSHVMYMGTEATGNAPNLAVTATNGQNESDNIVASFTLYGLSTSAEADAESVSASVSAYDASVGIGVPADAASAAGATLDTARQVPAGSASATTAAQQPTPGIGAAAGSASASAAPRDTPRHAAAGEVTAAVEVGTVSIPVAPGAEGVSATASALTPTLTGTDVSASPGTAQASVTVGQPHLDSPSGVTEVTASAPAPVVDIGGTPDELAVPATVYDPVIAIEFEAGSASASVTVPEVGITDDSKPPAPNVSASATVFQTSVVINGNPAQLAEMVKATAYDVTLRSEVVGNAGSTASAYGPTMFFGSTRVIKVSAGNRTALVAEETRTLKVEAS